MWPTHAEDAHRVLLARFWDDRRRLFRVNSRARLWSPHWHYWWQAHSLDCLVDAAVRHGGRSGADTDRIDALIRGILRRNGGDIGNDYRDDMAWMALAMLRAETDLGLPTRSYVDELWSLIKAAWDDAHGGVHWRRGADYANTPTNAPAAILAARLYALRADPADLEWARKIDDLLHATLVDADTGLVWDGIHPGDPGPSRDLWTYNFGTTIGAGVELFRATGETEFLTRATRTAEATIGRFSGAPGGLLPDEGVEDGGLFKGILARYLGDFAGLAAAGPVAGQVADLLRRNATAVARASGPVGPDWSEPMLGGGSLSCHLSALLLLEAVARLDPAGVAGADQPRTTP